MAERIAPKTVIACLVTTIQGLDQLDNGRFYRSLEAQWRLPKCATNNSGIGLDFPELPFVVTAGSTAAATDPPGATVLKRNTFWS